MSFFLVICLWSFLACKNNEHKQDHGSATPPSTASTNPQSSHFETIKQLPMISPDSVFALYSQADYLDFLFTSLPVSINASEPSSVRTHMQSFDPNPFVPKPCDNIGRMFIYSKGQQLTEADIYTNGLDCHYFVFYDGATPTHISGMTNTGKTFFKSILDRYR